MIHKIKLHSNKDLWRKIIKCTIAYEVGTILILIPQVNDHMGTVPYLVTLGTLFFNASGTAGNQIVEMILNIFIMVPAAIWCCIFKYLCTLYNRQPGYYDNGAGIIASLSFFICVFVIAYYRIKYPRLFIPALQGFTIPFFGLTAGIYDTQFDVMSIVGVLYPVLIGGGIALAVNLLLWPETAAKVSEASFGNALVSVERVLEFIDNEMLMESKIVFTDVDASDKLRQKIHALNQSILNMHKSRKEAKYELVVSRYSPVWYKALAKTLDELSHYLYGFSLVVEREGKILMYQENKRQSDEYQASHRHEFNEEPGHARVASSSISQKSDYVVTSTFTTTGHVRIEYKLISKLQSSVQKDIKCFIQACLSAIQNIHYRLRLEGAIHDDRRDIDVKEGSGDQLREAMDRLTLAKINFQNEYLSKREEPTEDHFLINTILFSLTEFGNKLIILKEQSEALIIRKTKGRAPTLFIPRVNLRKWLGKINNRDKGENTEDERILFDKQDLLQKQKTHVSNETHLSEDGPEPSFPSDEATERSAQSLSIGASIKSKASGQYEPPLQNRPANRVWKRWLYSFTQWTKTAPARYALKFAIIMELIALMAWLPIPYAREIYNENRGQWGLLAGMVVFNFTVGSTALQCMYRVFATILGAIAGYICIIAGGRDERPYVIAVLVLIFQIPLWYLLLGSPYPKIGFISLLTMIVIISTSYDDAHDESYFTPVWKRTLTSILAIILVLLLDQLLWPVWARKMVRIRLSELLIATGIQYSKVASLVCQKDTLSYRYKSTYADAAFNMKLIQKQYQFTCEMLKLAEIEPRITKGKFPIEIYEKILEHEQHIIFWIEHILKLQVFIKPDVRAKIINPMNSYRKDMAAAIHLTLFILASSILAKSALPASLPSAELSRKVLQRKQAALWQNDFDELFNATKGDGEHDDIENQMYWQAYAAGTIEVILEQEAIGALVARLMGQYVFQAATEDWIA
ncbi:hypothetical protein BDB01DRAFT_774049 [Pilobolus umbonatus]|nr:hypothetical protein BDB01DRAFT_774049 [Pilobolus umbonatus]